MLHKESRSTDNDYGKEKKGMTAKYCIVTLLYIVFYVIAI